MSHAGKSKQRYIALLYHLPFVWKNLTRETFEYVEKKLEEIPANISVAVVANFHDLADRSVERRQPQVSNFFINETLLTVFAEGVSSGG